MEFKLNQEQFEHILNILILYKQMNPKFPHDFPNWMSKIRKKRK